MEKSIEKYAFVVHHQKLFSIIFHNKCKNTFAKMYFMKNLVEVHYEILFSLIFINKWGKTPYVRKVF